MNCAHFGVCGGCQLDKDYSTQLRQKYEDFTNLLGFAPSEIFASPSRGFRARCELGIHKKPKSHAAFIDPHDVASCLNLSAQPTHFDSMHVALKNPTQEIFLSMNSLGKKDHIPIQNCPNLIPKLQKILHQLPPLLQPEILSYKLYAINLLGVGQGILSMIYHRKLEDSWEHAARNLAHSLGVSIIGRSKNQKILIGSDLQESSLNVAGRKLIYLHKEGNFSQPNPFINEKMLNFILACLQDHPRRDLLELYCGSGNFSIALADSFERVFATEVVKSAIPVLLENARRNDITNLTAARLSGLETMQALSFERDFFRLRGVDLRDFNFSHILVDPPRSGIGDIKMLHFLQKFPYIIYVSCNPHSLKRDFLILSQSHKVIHSALFDQFPHTHHVESIMILQKVL
ncbi:tRNA (uridine(54)-C5)-methyltransferase TrmA [Helicobacter mustelae]|uniref:tRNA (Uracil-5)-methyltransferase n=1 Tax=Helicobacter mustelae (strain ATCC 43772 / CCUG 25715 / CIP 103759 / LMG 18044 / NCTC 12198 / R85-136P) TaxID=679897 RepID=D3UG54_HELM1|nr:tRNA (uridine(54)-C5)-methyltransferase TrmA [Helicobacter mustelae]CBG39475.1 tRNA (uracil-5)-methyltransferase [Helicobacter mustelae 12198]SQH70988.1 tRNA (uracil-5)-methyltransferase [Helicobacter mustelae]STP12116.1 tRNA (uracil-5)-methyltransferase [Helicobacter mustelae]